ncbi:15791_t:CDS:2, partial [Acaulospora colombiana]
MKEGDMEERTHGASVQGTGLLSNSKKRKRGGETKFANGSSGHLIGHTPVQRKVTTNWARLLSSPTTAPSHAQDPPIIGGTERVPFVEATCGNIKDFILLVGTSSNYWVKLIGARFGGSCMAAYRPKSAGGACVTKVELASGPVGRNSSVCHLGRVEEPPASAS